MRRSLLSRPHPRIAAATSNRLRPLEKLSTTVNMSWLGVTPFKKFPAPFLKPMWPFFAAGLVIAYGVNSAQNGMMASDQWKDVPRNPRPKTDGH